MCSVSADLHSTGSRPIWLIGNSLSRSTNNLVTFSIVHMEFLRDLCSNRCFSVCISHQFRTLLCHVVCSFISTRTTHNYTSAQLQRTSTRALMWWTSVLKHYKVGSCRTDCVWTLRNLRLFWWARDSNCKRSIAFRWGWLAVIFLSGPRWRILGWASTTGCPWINMSTQSADPPSSTYEPSDTFVDRCPRMWPTVLLLPILSVPDSHRATAKNIRKLQLVQNTAARVVNLSQKRDHIKPILKSLHWLPANDRITVKLATTVFKILSCSEPSYLREFLNDYNPTRCPRFSHKHLLTVPACHTSIASRAFSVSAHVLWNSIDIDLKQSDSVASLKINIKTRLFKSYFG